MSKKIVFANNKGGVLKTTLSTNLACYLASKNKKVLLIDTDTQNNVLFAFNINKKVDLNNSLYEVVFENKAFKEIIYNYNSNLDIVYVNKKWLNFEYDIQIKSKTFKPLNTCLNEIENDYDYIIFDTEPKKSASTFSVLLSSNDIIIPFELSKYSIIGIMELNNFIKLAQSKNPDLKIKSFIPVKTIFNSKSQKELLNNIGTSLPIKKVSQITIPASIKPDNSILNYQSPILLNPNQFRCFNIYKKINEYFDTLDYK